MEIEEMFKVLMLIFSFFVIVCLFQIFARLRRLENSEKEFIQMLYNMPELKKDEETFS